MKQEETQTEDVYGKILVNLKAIMYARGLKQATMAMYAGTTPSQFSRILNGTVQLSILQLANIATELQMNVIDIITYPKRYVEEQKDAEQEPVEAILQIKLRHDKRDQVLSLVFGENNLEILNK